MGGVLLVLVGTGMFGYAAYYVYEQSLSIEYHRYGNLGEHEAARQP